MIYAVIPARYDSTRFPGKPLVRISGVTMIQRVYEQALKARLVDKVIVATDDERIKNVVTAFGGNAVMTSKEHNSGTDRIAEVILNKSDADIIVNLQGDEPIIHPESIDNAVKPLLEQSNIGMSTLIRKCENKKDLDNPNIVKVVIDRDAYAIYFSRSCVPYIRNEGGINHYLHVGLYVYKRDTLLKLSQLSQSELELTESLEQLRAIYNGIKIKTVMTDYIPISVDIPGDVKTVEEQIKKLTLSLGG